jgi:hypothetical protein
MASRPRPIWGPFIEVLTRRVVGTGARTAVSIEEPQIRRSPAVHRGFTELRLACAPGSAKSDHARPSAKVRRATGAARAFGRNRISQPCVTRDHRTTREHHRGRSSGEGQCRQGDKPALPPLPRDAARVLAAGRYRGPPNRGSVRSLPLQPAPMPLPTIEDAPTISGCAFAPCDPPEGIGFERAVPWRRASSRGDARLRGVSFSAGSRFASRGRRANFEFMADGLSTPASTRRLSRFCATER